MSVAEVTPVEADEMDKKKKEKPPPEPAVSLAELFQYATPIELVMLAIGCLMLTGVGVCNPLMLLPLREIFGLLGASAIIPGAKIPMEAMLRVLLTLVFIGCGIFVFHMIGTVCLELVAASQMLKYKRSYLKAVLRQDVGWYDVSNPEELSTQFAEAMVKIQKGLKSIAMLFMGLGYGSGGGILAFLPSVGNWEISLVTLGTVPILVIAASIMMYVVGNGAKLVAAAYGQAGGVATECLFSMRTITALGIEKKFEKRYAHAMAKVRRTTIINTSVFMCSSGVALSAYLIMMAVAIIYGCYRLAYEIEASGFPYIVPINEEYNISYHYCADQLGQFINVTLEKCEYPMYMSCQYAGIVDLTGNTTLTEMAQSPLAPDDFEIPSGYENYTLTKTLGFDNMTDFTTFVKEESPEEYLEGNPSYYSCYMGGENILLAILGVMMMGEGFSMAGQPAQHITLAQQAAAKVFQIIGRIPAIDSFSDEGLKPAQVTGNIEVRDVVFAYPSSPDTLVCNSYSLSIPAGQMVALCGPSGSGKSTIVQLIERFYDPQSGVVTLDGVDIKTLNVRWLRSQLGLVSQEPMLFQGTVAENIAYGATGEATQAMIEEAATMANAHGFITEVLSDGYQTSVGQAGSKLSGGQKQRVAIARALIKKPSVLLLDEATSALDTKSEKIVQAALDEIMTKQKRTTVVIAHRLSTIRNADKIAVLKDGRVVEEGTYDSLIQINEGLFRGLAEKQEALLATDKAAVAGAEAPEAAEVETAMEVKVVGDKKGDTKAKDKDAKDPKEKEESAPLMRVFALQKDHAGSLVLMCIFSGAACALSTYSFYLLAVVMEIVFEPLASVMRERAVNLSIQLAIFAAAVIASFTLSGFFNGLAGSALTAKLRSRGMSCLMRQETGFFDQEENSATELTAFLAEKVDKVKTISTEQLDLVAQLIGGVSSFIVILILYCDWRLLLMWMAMIAIMGIISPMQMAFMTGEDAIEQKKKKGIEDTSKLGKATNSANKIVGDAVMGIRTVASFNLEQRFYDGFAASSSEIAYVQKRDAFTAGFFLGLTDLVMFSSMGAVFFYSLWLANQGLLEFIDVVAPMFAMMGVMVPMLKAGALADLKNASNAALRLFKLFDRIPLIDNLSEVGESLSSVTGNIEVVDVVFAYPSAPDTLVCKGYSLSIPAGDTLALCGPSGSGKSTIISLLERFYDPQSGSITLDGVDIKTLNVRWLRSQLGLVSQEPVLFQGTVAENIGYGATGEVTQAMIEEAATMANAHGFITETLGDGYKTDVGLKGGKLSGGQKQRVAIARAIIKKPAVLLLDEATSALDNESERIVQAALDEIMTKQRRTTVVIAHRLSTIRNAAKIAVVYEGAIAEQGTHDELLAKHGLYMNLVMSS